MHYGQGVTTLCGRDPLFVVDEDLHALNHHRTVLSAARNRELVLSRLEGRVCKGQGTDLTLSVQASLVELESQSVSRVLRSF